VFDLRKKNLDWPVIVGTRLCRPFELTPSFKNIPVKRLTDFILYLLNTLPTELNPLFVVALIVECVDNVSLSGM